MYIDYTKYYLHCDKPFTTLYWRNEFHKLYCNSKQFSFPVLKSVLYAFTDPSNINTIPVTNLFHYFTMYISPHHLLNQHVLVYILEAQVLGFQPSISHEFHYLQYWSLLNWQKMRLLCGCVAVHVNWFFDIISSCFAKFQNVV